MNYRPVLSDRVLQQLGGIPTEALSELGKIMAVVCENPYDPLATASTTEGPEIRRADFGGYGFVTFLIIDSTMIVRITDVIWAG